MLWNWDETTHERVKKGDEGDCVQLSQPLFRATLPGDLVEPLLQEPAGGKEVTAFVDVK